MRRGSVVLAVTVASVLACGPQISIGESDDQSDSGIYLDSLRGATRIERRLRRAGGADAEHLERLVHNGTVRRGDFNVARGDSVEGHILVAGGDAVIAGKLIGNLVTLDGDVTVHPTGLVSGEVVVLGGEVKDLGGEIRGTVRAFGTPAAAPAAPPPTSALQHVLRRLAGTAGIFLTFMSLGIGLVLFARPKLEVVSDTISHSFGRSLVIGLIGQILLVPTFGVLVVGLIVSVVGILLLPFAVVAYVLLAAVGLGGGYLAVAHAMGETYTRRRLAAGDDASPNSYRYLALGLGALAVLWMAWALFGWVPVAGALMWAAAFFVTWLLATAGFGAMLLSRAGTRTSFAGWER